MCFKHCLNVAKWLTKKSTEIRAKLFLDIDGTTKDSWSRFSHHSRILATGVCLFCAKYEKVVRMGRETEIKKTNKPAPGGVQVPLSQV